MGFIYAEDWLKHTQCFAWNKWQDSKDLTGKNQFNMSDAVRRACYKTRTGSRRRLHSKAGGSFMAADPGTHWGLKPLLSAGRLWPGTSTSGDFLSVLKMISWCKSTSEDALLDLWLTNKEELDRDVEIKSSLGCSNRETGV